MDLVDGRISRRPHDPHASRLAAHEPKMPSARIKQGEPVFFPNEVHLALGLGSIEYRQMRKLVSIVRLCRGDEPFPPPPPNRRWQWTRYTLADVAGLQRLLALAGADARSNGNARKALFIGRTLVLRNVVAACQRLRELGYLNPLLDVELQRDGHTILAKIDGALFDPSSGQTVLDEVHRRLASLPSSDEAGTNLAAERAEQQPQSPEMSLTHGITVVAGRNDRTERSFPGVDR